MKLIIDIPEKVVTAIQNGKDYRFDIHTAIAQGIPYEERPQGDLISREAMIKAFNKAKWSGGDDIPTAIVYDFIEDFPAVAESCKELQEVEKETPQGEWIYKEFDVESGISRSYWCSNCGEPKSQWCDDFCQRCGADMRGGAE